MSSLDLRITLVAAVVTALVLRSQLWRALAALFPTWLRLETDAPADQLQLPASFHSAAESLRALGFGPLGRRLTQRPLGRAVLSYDFLSDSSAVFATLTAGPGGEGRPRLTFLTRTAGGGFVLTADHWRPARELPGRYVSGGLEGAPADRVYRAHLKRLEAFQVEQSATLEGRLEAEWEWLHGPGKLEVRQQNFLGLLWSLGSLGMLAVVLVNRFG